MKTLTREFALESRSKPIRHSRREPVVARGFRLARGRKLLLSGENRQGVAKTARATTDAVPVLTKVENRHPRGSGNSVRRRSGFPLLLALAAA